MNEQQILEKLKQIAAPITGMTPDDHKADVTLTELGVDSLGMADFMFDIEDELGFNVDLAELANKGVNTLGKLAAHLATLKAA